MVEFGFFALTLGFCLSLYGLGMGSLTLFRPVRGAVLSARNALIGVNICAWIGALTVWYGLLTHDFSIRYVYRNSAVDMPFVYLFASFWSALEGSHLLWTLILSSMVSVALITVRPRNESLLPGLVAAFGLVESFMLLLLVWASAPLTRMFPSGEFGQGLNPLLQNPYMAAHPPSLFAGYSSLIIPFAYGFAALLRGSFTPEWLVTVRRWTLAGWAVLTVGIFLGGKWAYVELGWAGYWAWDPVENSSFMPWLASTAALHTLLILDKSNRLPRLAVFLGMLAFALTFMGTFITRSGVISSVHSFAESNIGPAYLSFIIVLLGASLLLLALRGHLLQGAARANVWTVSKESALLFTNFFLLFLLALVLIGTILPLIVEAIRGVKISIQQPFFNFFAPWIAVGLVGLVGVGNLVRWKNGKIQDPLASLAMPLLWSTLITSTLAYRKGLDVRSTIGFFLIIWSAGVLIMDLVYRLKALRWNGTAFLKFNRPYFGSWIVHIGFLLAITGFLGGYRGIEAQTDLNLGESTDFYGYKLTNKGLSFREGSNVRVVEASIQAIDSKGNETEIVPQRTKYTNKDEWLNEIGIHSNFWHDVYLVLASFDTATQKVSLKMHINPTVKFVWTSLVVMVLGALIGLSHKVIPKNPGAGATAEGLELETMTLSFDSHFRGADESAPTPGYATSVGVLIFVIALSIFGLSGSAFAADEASKGAPSEKVAPVLQLDPQLRDVGNELRCPTCQGVSILESDTPQSRAMRMDIERRLAKGEDKQTILRYFKERYGEWILRKPDSESAIGKWIWSLPIAGLLAGPVVLVFGLKNSQKRNDAEREEIARQLKAFIDTHTSKGRT